MRFLKLLIEVLPAAAESTDRREKILSYAEIGTLEEYVLVVQEISVFVQGEAVALRDRAEISASQR